MIVKCTTDEFCDQITNGSTYRVLEVKNNSYQIKNDQGNNTWFGQVNFNIENVKS